MPICSWIHSWPISLLAAQCKEPHFPEPVALGLPGRCSQRGALTGWRARRERPGHFPSSLSAFSGFLVGDGLPWLQPLFRGPQLLLGSLLHSPVSQRPGSASGCWASGLPAAGPLAPEAVLVSPGYKTPVASPTTVLLPIT